jgi:uncharacterized membrane protein
MTRWLYVSIALTAAAFAASLYVYDFEYDRLPDQVPIHWNIDGVADGFVPKEDALRAFFLLPAVMAGFVLLTLALPWLSPRHFEVDTFRDVYGYVMMLVVALFGYIHVATLWGSLQRDRPVDVGRLVVGGILLFLALIGNVLGRVRRNFWVGVRTPWTLASDGVWNATHRLAAWLFVAAGVLGLVAAVAGAPLLWCFVGIMIAALAPVVYSLVLYKRLERQGRL